MKKFVFLFFILVLHGFLIADYSYDENGNIASIYIPENGEVLYRYDPIQRLVEARYPNGKHFSYTYDYNSNLQSVESPDGTTKYTYDKLNRIETVHLPDGGSLAYQYDLMGRVTSLTYPDGETVEYSYDCRGRLKTLRDCIGVTTYEYDDLTNLVSKETLPNGTTTEYRYDETPQILEVSHRNSSGALIQSFSYEYNKVGQITQCIEKTPLSTTIKHYTYDDLDRLLRSEDNQGNFEEYSYDGVGNRLTKSTQNGTINYRYNNKNRLIQAGNTTYHYDSVGNLIQKTSHEKTVKYSYDPTGKLTHYSDEKTHVEFGYDGEGRRISKTVNGQTTFFINDPQSQISRVLIEKDGTGQLKKKYIYGHARVMQKEESITRYFLYDQPGKSVCSLLDHHTLDQSPIHYDSFGNLSSPISETSYFYNGEEYDEETGLIFLRNRYYDPETGRFISPDFILGNLQDPQSLNPYVFVRNNPLSLVDPLGLYGVKVPLTFYGNYPGARTPSGKSRVGHGWIGGIGENGTYFTQGAWPGAATIERDETNRSLCPETVHMTVWVIPEQALAARAASGEPKYSLFRNNCIDHVVKALDAIQYPHPTFKAEPRGISLPTIYCDWINQERNHIHPNFLPQPGDILVDYSMPSPANQSIESPGKFSFSHFTPNYGGVLLDKSAEVFTELSDISGVIYDEQMQQMILYGHKNLALPYMDMDDLAVAIRSIYGLGRKGPESPGVSMEPGTRMGRKKKKACMVVSYFGETKNTRFGQIMFEADRVLKILSIGKDNITGKPIKSSVPHYHNLKEIRYKKGLSVPSTSCRMWFVPQRIALSESQDGTSMVFSDARMEVLTESTLRKKGIVEDKAAEKFAHHFTQYYDHFSREYPILTELKRLGKITAIVKWIQEKNLPFDLSFFQNYTPYYMATPEYSPITADMLGQHYIIGGVVYILDSRNYLVQKNKQADQIKKEVLSERPNDEALSWNFGRGMTAVAKQIGKSLKVGEVRKTFVDLTYAGGSIPLSFVRTYSSFNETSFPFGRGWECVPAKIHFHHGLAPFSFSDGTALNLYPQITVQLEGIESVYTLAGLTQEKEPIYKKEKSPFYLLQDTEGTFTWHRQNETLTFNPQGQLTHLLDLSGRGLQYHYDEGYLTQICHSSGEAITLEYIGDQLCSITGPGGKTIYYEYDTQGKLQKIHDTEGTLASYGYDDGHRLSAIYNSKGNPIFSAKYDNHHRAIKQTIGENVSTQSFNLRDRFASFKTAANTYQHQFDPEYRPKCIQDALGREVNFTYGENEGAQKIVTSTGLEVEYEYDTQGRLIKVSNEYEGERYFSYNSQGRVSHEIDGNKNETLYQYDRLGRLIAIYRPFLLTSIRVFDNQTTIEGNPNYLTTFEHNEDSNLLESITFPDGQKETYHYNTQGLPTQIKLSNGTTITREYDARHRLTKAKVQGKEIQYGYDSRDHITKITTQEKSNHFSYDLSGNLTSHTDPLNRTTKHTYDSHEKLIQTIDPLKQSTTYEYNPSGLCKMHLPNGSTREIFYDEHARPTAIR